MYGYIHNRSTIVDVDEEKNVLHYMKNSHEIFSISILYIRKILHP